MSSLTSIKFASISSGALHWLEGAGEHRAAFIAVLFAGIVSEFFAFAIFLPKTIRDLILLAVIGGGVLALIMFVLPFERVERLRDVSSKRFDECDVMFAHARLQTGTERYQAYYASWICRSGCGWLKWGS